MSGTSNGNRNSNRASGESNFGGAMVSNMLIGASFQSRRGLAGQNPLEQSPSTKTNVTNQFMFNQVNSAHNSGGVTFKPAG